MSAHRPWSVLYIHEAYLMSRNTVYVTPNPGGKGWVNKLGGEIVSKHRSRRMHPPAVERLRASSAPSIQSIAVMERSAHGRDALPPRDNNR